MRDVSDLIIEDYEKIEQVAVQGEMIIYSVLDKIEIIQETLKKTIDDIGFLKTQINNKTFQTEGEYITKENYLNALNLYIKEAFKVFYAHRKDYYIYQKKLCSIICMMQKFWINNFKCISKMKVEIPDPITYYKQCPSVENYSYILKKKLKK